METTPSSINKTDNASTPRAPRRRFTAQQRKAILERYRASGLKQQEFIVREGISKASLGKWLKGERGEAAAKLNKPRFHELLMAQTPVTPWQMEIVSPKNWTLRFAAVPNETALEPLLRSLPC